MHERILIVDDQQSIQGLLSRICERAGYDVRVAGDGQTAIDLLEEAPIDIGIFDLVLPDSQLGGIEVLRKAKELYPDCQVIIVTGHAGSKAPSKRCVWALMTIWKSPCPACT